MKKSSDEIELSADPDRRSRKIQGENKENSAAKDEIKSSHKAVAGENQEVVNNRPKSAKLIKAGTFDGDVRNIKYKKPIFREAPEREAPNADEILEGDPVNEFSALPNYPSAAAPSPLTSFDGLDFATFGAGRPPDTNGDVGPDYFIQSVNSSIGIYNKTSGARVAGFTLNTFMSQGGFTNLCANNNFGDPVVLYDTFEDRWIITDFAFTIDGAGNVTSNSYQCFAASKTNDPVTGGWNFYSTVDTDFLGDYPKFGVWNDGIYWSANMFGKSSTGGFANPRVRAMNKMQMYVGNPTVQVVTFDAPSSEFTLLPSNARLQTGTPPAGTPNYFVSTSAFLNALTIYKFKVDWNKISTSTFTGPSLQFAPASWSSAPANVSTPSLSTATNIDTLASRAMVQNQYTNIGGVESLWNTHTVQGSSTTQSAIRYYQGVVMGGNVAANTTQAATFNPDTVSRLIPSLAVNRSGDMGLLYSASSATLNPAIRYAGRLAGDPLNTLPQSETSLIEGGGYQNTSTRWGDYSTMTLDPNGCTFWMTTEYFGAVGGNWLTRIGSFAFPSCIPLLNNGVLQGTVTSSVTNLPISGATVNFGSRKATTDSSGVYSFANLPAGTYLNETASATGFDAANAANLAVADGATTTQNFTLGVPPSSACLIDTTQSDFQTGVPTSVDLNTTAGDLTLLKGITLDQQNTNTSTSGNGVTTTSWTSQTFIPAVSGPLVRADINLFCSGCTGTAPSVTVSLRATTAGLPTGADLAATTFTTSTSGAGGFFTATFTSPATVTAGTTYAIVVRNAINPSVGTNAAIRSAANAYANGARVTSTNSGTTWTAQTTDLGFRTYIDTGFALSGNLISSLKDSNPAAAGNSVWTTISWNASVPANTNLQFQVAGNNNPNGTFNYVGPDGTAATFFTTSNSSLSQFNGLRYLKYRALMTTTVNTVTPTINDVTICYTNPPLFVWTGAKSSNWSDPLNWMSGVVPRTTDKAVIPAGGISNSPVNTTNNTVGSLELDSSIIDTGSNTLTVNTCSPNAVTGGSATSFVRGTLVRCVDGTGTYNFPVGTSGGFAPVSLSGVVGSGTFTVAPKTGSLIGSDPGQSISRNWGLTPSGITQANITFKYLDADVPAGADETTFKFLRLSGGITRAFPASSSDVAANTFTLNNVASFSDWSLGVPTAPTAAGSTVSGRVLNSRGVGIANAVLEMRSTQRNTVISVRTNNFGNFSFNDIAAGQTYLLSVNAKTYTFTPRLLSVQNNLTGIDFTPNAVGK